MYRDKVSFSLMIFERLNGEMELIVNYFHYRVPIFLVVSIVWTSGAVPSESQQTPPLSPIYEGKNNCSNYSHRALRDSLGKCTVLCSLFDNYYQDSQRPGCSGWFSDSGGSAKSKLLVKADFFCHIRECERERENERENADAFTEVKFKQRKLEHFIENCSRNWLHFLLLILCI